MTRDGTDPPRVRARTARRLWTNDLPKLQYNGPEEPLDEYPVNESRNPRRTIAARVKRDSSRRLTSSWEEHELSPYRQFILATEWELS